MAIYNASTTAALAAPATASPLRYYSEKSTAIAYAGSWATASHPRYVGGAATYATKPGSTATFTFTGTKVIWYGPVGPTRGQARVLVDGVYVKTVNLNSSTFTAHKAVYSRAWATAGRHTVQIDVVGTAGHPYVAIDQFTVAN